MLSRLEPRLGPVELCCMWFDDLYRPGDSGKELFDPKVWERGLKEWEILFYRQRAKGIGRI